VSPKEFTAFRLEVAQLEALRAIRDRDGIPVSEQVRRAIDKWVELRGVTVKADRKRAATRKRS
jgi:hypothetical protein